MLYVVRLTLVVILYLTSPHTVRLHARSVHLDWTRYLNHSYIVLLPEEAKERSRKVRGFCSAPGDAA